MLQLYTSERCLAFPKVQPSACYEKLPWSYFRPTPLAWLLSTCLHGGGGSQVSEVTRLGGVTRLSIWSLILIWSRLHDRWGDPPRRVARSTRPGNPLSWGQILPYKRSRWGNPPSRGPNRDTWNSSRIHFGGSFASLLKEKIESHSTEGCSKSSKWV